MTNTPNEPEPTVVVAYHLKWRDACDFLYSIEDQDDADDLENIREAVQEQIEDRYHSFEPYGPQEGDTITFASRYEQHIMDLVDRMGVPYERTDTEVPTPSTDY